MSLLALAAVLAAAAVAAGLARSLVACAARLHRLHQRVGSSREVLEAALDRRAGAAGALAASGALSRADAEALADAASRARRAGRAVAGDREAAESALSRALRAVLAPATVRAVHAAPGGGALLADLAAACQRVVLARRFANDAVSSARRLRRTRRVRWAHLAGSAPLPRTFDVDDEPPVLAPGPRREHEGTGASRRSPA